MRYGSAGTAVMSIAQLSVSLSASTERLVVVGDAMLDRTRWVRSLRAESASSTLPIYTQAAESVMLGGAAYVAALLSSFGFPVDFVSVIGNDTEGRTLLSMLEDLQVRTLVQMDGSRPTTVKERLISGSPVRPRVLARFDREASHPLRSTLSRTLLHELQRAMHDCAGVLVSAYDKGVCTPLVLQSAVGKAAQLHVPIVVDPSRTGLPPGEFPCDVLTPNRSEAEELARQTVRTSVDAARAGHVICQRTGARACAVTLDAEGAVLSTADGGSESFPSERIEAVDSTGAGDAFAATVLSGLVSGCSLSQSVGAANLVASLQVQCFGTALLGRAALAQALLKTRPDRRPGTAEKILATQSIHGVVSSLRRKGHRIVLTNGCFDLLHPGHVKYLEEAAAEGESLIVAINSDATVRALKGPERPIVPASERAQMLAALNCVDYVVVFQEPTPHRILRMVRPDVLVKGGGYRPEEVVGREIVTAYGGTVKTLSLSEGWSTTALVERMSSPRPRLSDAG
jgi:D-beta-D-heptose 7-phosphate kinase / D-beta-D-heptose 1-phosphate adenosyltransferase